MMKNISQVLARYDPRSHPQFASTNPRTPGKIDLLKVPMKDRFAVEIMENYDAEKNPKKKSSNMRLYCRSLGEFAKT